MFVDEVEVKLYAGNGGDGCTSFRREKFIPMGGPDGGNGGRGASIIFVGDKNLKTLVDLRYKKIIKGGKGQNGEGSNRYGKNTEDIKIKVPLGTTVIDKDTNLIIADITRDKEETLICKGGRGGRGNKSFATHSDPAPHLSEKGEPGEERIVKCELKVLADVGLIGMPSVGKSTILSMISAAHPKIAAYHFTTLNPNIGVVTLKNGNTFTMADLPGLISGANEGVGLGIKFLKHTSRAKILIHIIDMGSIEGRNPIEDYEVIRKELEKYDKKLLLKEKLIVANKMDLPNAKDNLDKFKSIHSDLPIVEISAKDNIGLDVLIEKIGTILEETKGQSLYNEYELENHILYKFKEEIPFSIIKENDRYILSGERIEKLFKMTRIETEEGALRFAKKLKRMGVDEELEKMGAKKGDEVEILGFTFTFKD